MKKMLGILIGMAVLMLYAANVSAFTLNWDPVTKYTDNTAIGSEAEGVFYNVEMDGAAASGDFTGTSWNIPAVPKKSAHTFRVRTALGALDNTGTQIRSAWSPPFAWTSPQGVPVIPSGITVRP